MWINTCRTFSGGREECWITWTEIWHDKTCFRSIITTLLGGQTSLSDSNKCLRMDSNAGKVLKGIQTNWSSSKAEPWQQGRAHSRHKPLVQHLNHSRHGSNANAIFQNTNHLYFDVYIFIFYIFTFFLLLTLIKSRSSIHVQCPPWDPA